MSDSGVVALAVHAMGCRFELILSGGEESWLRAAGEEALDEIVSAHARLTRFERGSVVSLLNEGAAVRVDDELFGLFELGERVRRESFGAFDLRRGGVGELAIDSNHRTAASGPGTTIDLGGIAKGFAIDQALAVLREAGVSSAFLHGGSSSAGSIGYQCSGEPWRVALHSPRADRPLLLDLTDRCMAVSSDEQQPDHLVDPRTGQPCGPGIMAACVGSSAAVCDAWATALAVLGHRPATAPPDLVTYIPTPIEIDSDMTHRGWTIEPTAEVTEEHRRLTPCHPSTAERS